MSVYVQFVYVLNRIRPTFCLLLLGRKSNTVRGVPGVIYGYDDALFVVLSLLFLCARDEWDDHSLALP